LLIQDVSAWISRNTKERQAGEATNPGDQQRKQLSCNEVGLKRCTATNYYYNN